MRKLITILCLFLAFKSNATNYYVSTTGSNSNAGTSSGAAWLTVAYAVAHVSSGDNINIATGTYTEAQFAIPAGVNMTGSGSGTILKSSYSSLTGFAITMTGGGTPSTVGQTISNINFDGSTYTTYHGINVADRSNVIFTGCQFNKYYISGLQIGTGSYQTTGLQITSCLFYNCAARGITGTGNMGDLVIFRTSGTVISGCTFDNTDGSITNHGDQINTYNGHTLSLANYGMKVHNNAFTRHALDSGDGGFCFSMEMEQTMDETEIYNNTFDYGGIDFNGCYANPGYAYSVSIHDNTFIVATRQGSYDNAGIQFEADACTATTTVANIEHVLIYNNYFNKTSSNIYITTTLYSPATSLSLKGNKFYSNVFDDVGDTGGGGSAFKIAESSGTNMDSLYFYNNTIKGKTTTGYAVYWKATGSSHTNVHLDNNIFDSCAGGGQAAILVWNGGTFSGSIDNNDSYGNATGLVQYNNSSSMTSGTTASNITTNPLFVSSSDFHLQAGSPCINAAKTGYGYTDIGRYQYSSATTPILFRVEFSLPAQ